MKDSKTIRNEHQSFVDAYKKINQSSVQDKPVEEGYGYKSMDKKKKKTKKEEMVLVRKSNAFTALAEKYNMSPKQFGRYVEANQHLFDIPTRRKATLANKFQGFKETKEWDEFFGDLELVEMGFLGKKGKFEKIDGKVDDIIDDGKTDFKKLFKLKKGANKDKFVSKGAKLDKAHYEPEGELVDEGAPYTVHVADKKGNTPAWQGYVEGKINKITGEPLYVAGEDLQQEGIVSTIKNLMSLGKDKDHKVSPKTPMGQAVTGLQKRRQENDKALEMLNQETEVDGEDLQEITTKDTKSGTKFKVRVKDKATGSSYIRFATRDKIAQLRSDPKIASVEMTDEGQTPEERGEKKAQAAGGGSQKKAKKDYDGDGKVETGSQEYLGSRDKAIKKAMKKRSVTTESNINYAARRAARTGYIKPESSVPAGSFGISAKGKEQAAANKAAKKNTVPSGSFSISTKGKEQATANKAEFKAKENKSVVSDTTKQGKPRTKAQMMAAKRIASGKTIQQVKDDNKEAIKTRAKERFKTFKARRMTKEELSNWREDLKEIMGEVEKTEVKKSKSKKMKNGICINPDTDDEKNKYEEVNAKKIAENLGAELQSLKIEDADGNVAYEIVDLVKPDPIKENVLSEVEGTNMFPKGTQKRVKNILDKGSEFMNTTKVGGVLKKIFGPSNPKNQSQ